MDVSALPLLSVADVLTSQEPPVRWLVPNFIPAGSLIALAGEPGAGKSFLAYTISIALATGTDVLGYRIAPTRVLYFDQENSRPDSIQYLRWAWHGLRKPSLELITKNLFFAPFQLGGAGWAGRAAQFVSDCNPELIIIDTTTPSCHIQDENDNAEATRVINQIRSLMAMTNPVASAIVLKHAKVRSDDGSYTLRGAKSWEGAVDAVLYHTRMRGRPPKGEGLRPTKVEPSKVRAFGLREGFKIVPRWTDEARTGIVLAKELLHDEVAEAVEEANQPQQQGPKQRQRWQKAVRK